MKYLVFLLTALLIAMTWLAVHNSRPLVCDETQWDEKANMRVCKVFVK